MNETNYEEVAELLDEHPLTKGIGHRCLGCDYRYESSDRIVVEVTKNVNQEKWSGPLGDCINCADREIPEEYREEGFDQYVIEIGLKKTPWDTVLDANQLEIIYRSPPSQGVA